MTIQRRFLHAKLHHARITHADVAYEGSITIAPELLARAGILPHEAVWVWDVTNGARLETYTITGEPGSSTMTINGAAAHLIHPGDTVIIAAFAWCSEEEGRLLKPRVLFLDEHNQVVREGSEVPASVA